MNDDLTIANAQLLLSRITTVEDLIKWWTLMGPNRTSSYPSVERLTNWKVNSR